MYTVAVQRVPDTARVARAVALSVRNTPSRLIIWHLYGVSQVARGSRVADVQWYARGEGGGMNAVEVQTGRDDLGKELCGDKFCRAEILAVQ